jgi:hypothetical protein
VHGRVELERLDVVPQRLHLLAHLPPRLAFVVAQEQRCVLEQEVARVVVREYLHQYLLHLVPWVGLALHHALSAEGLAREAGAEHVVSGYGRHVQFQRVASRQTEVVVRVVQTA